ncbi:keratin-associated protein 19-2-like [Ylistrum balloti]|uniref:keratin-associated protein 19-2-like n=1 Tax=Ylistrum balloti TaxID=509963 RepID=UPI002905A8A4|nr:keratin-associated protein 19-2-like [Ylistrum balloti]
MKYLIVLLLICSLLVNIDCQGNRIRRRLRRLGLGLTLGGILGGGFRPYGGFGYYSPYGPYGGFYPPFGGYGYGYGGIGPVGLGIGLGILG